MTLGEKIKNYRLLKGLTQKELGMRVGFSEATAGRFVIIANRKAKPAAPRMFLAPFP